MILSEDEVFPLIRYWSNRYYNQFKAIINDPDELFNIVFLGKIQKVEKIEHATTAIRQDIIDFLRKEARRNSYCCCSTFEDIDIECPEELTQDQRDFLCDLDKIVAKSHLTIKEQFVIYNYYYQARTIKEIADIMEMSKSSVSNIHTHTLYKLQKTGEEQNEFLCGSR